jgi:uncharacterized protein (UPF0548 family)
VGGTRGELPTGYRHDRFEIRLGTGPDAMAAGAEGLRRWECHRHAGIAVWPDRAPIEEGTTVALGVTPLPGVHALFADRIVYVVEEPHRFGFGYGTVAGHPERGEEAFIVEGDDDGSVWLRLTIFSRPEHALARLGAPVTRAVQLRATRAYLEGLRRYVGNILET